MRQEDRETRRGGDGETERAGANGKFLLSPFLSFYLSPLLLFPILALAAFLRFHALDASSLWSDEGNTWALIQHSFSYIASAAAADIHPPGYYWLLKLWANGFGTSAYAMRSFSALCGILLVWVIYRIALQLRISHTAFRIPYFALVAAFLAAINPFQIYYSQEARMYMLLALESAGLMWAVLEMERKRDGEIGRWRAVGVYAICASAGLWTHYSFPIVLLAAGIFWVFWILDFGFWKTSASLQNPFDFLYANLVALLLFLPWLPTALIRVFAWPNQGSEKTFVEAAAVIAHTIWFGPLTTTGWLATAALVLISVLSLLGIWQLRRDRQSWLLILWLILPIGLMLGAGLFRDAYLKFLLVASPAWCLLAAAIIDGQTENVWGRRFLRTTHYALLVLLALVSFPALQNYYANPTARDNYQGVARYLDAVADPQRALVILDAPGQSDVWGYYNSPECYSADYLEASRSADSVCSGLFDTLKIPQQRPPDEAQTIATLENSTSDRQQIFALFWATNEADPQNIVERWLDAHAFKGLDQWQGNLRFVTYSLPSNLDCQVFPAAIRFGDAIELTQICQPQLAQQVYPGVAAIVGLRWQSSAKLERRYKVSLQLLDSRNQLIAQRDSEPGGDSLPTIDWQPGALIVDNHGLVIPAGVPPGNYRLIVALYDAESGERLSVGNSDFAEIGSVTVVRPPRAIPVEIVPIQHRVNHRFASGLTLVGYDLYERGFAHDPTKQIDPGATAHVTLYWQAPTTLPPDWTADQQFTLQWGKQSISASLAGGNYPTSGWQPGELVRGEFEIVYDDSEKIPELSLGPERLPLH